MPTPEQTLYVSYLIEPDDSLPDNTFRLAVTAIAGDPRRFICDLYNERGGKVIRMATTGGTTRSKPIPFDRFAGKSLSARLNYADSGLDDIVVPLVFADDLATALNQRDLHFVWSARTVEVAGPARPLIELDPHGSPVVLSYDVPEPTSYRGRHVIELDFPDTYFIPPSPTTPAERKATPAERKAMVTPAPTQPGPGSRPATSIVSGPSDIYGSPEPIRGDATPNRTLSTELTRDTVTDAFNIAQQTGYFDPEVFPNVQAGNETFSRACVMEALAGLDVATVYAQLNAGNQLTIYRDISGRCIFRFIPAPARAVPTLLLVEYYRLSSFPARYGAGRTIKTFSLLPGERSRIRLNTYKRSTESIQRSTSIVDSTSDDTESEFERTVLAEQTRQDNTNKSFEYQADVSAEAKGSWGWGSASVKASGGVKGVSNAAREEFAKNVSNSVAHNAARASSRRDVEVDTSLDVKLETGEEQAVERDLENINVSRTLNFVFRQMNQEFVSLLHLVDVRVAFFNGYRESRLEVPLPHLQELLDTYIVADHQDEVRAAITAELDSITDYRGEVHPDFVQTVTLTGEAKSDSITYLRVNPDTVSGYQTGSDGPVVYVPGIILAADSHVMRTDGVVVDSFLGLGNGLDDYSIGLQAESVRARRIENDRHQAEVDRLELATQIVESGDTVRAALYRQLFPPPQIVNQVDQAVIGQTADGSRPTSATA
ncbi:hypothetical protein [Planosporangium mesophilum]|nr:hypothetical protein [Planosporangium mesophilum]NJC85930.1 hypothetical protein [Planosporangium mesophilum]